MQSHTSPAGLLPPFTARPGREGKSDVRSTKPTNLPVRPPTLPSALAAPFAALAAPASAGPAAEVTRDRPWAALDWTFWAASLVASAAFFACAEAASVLWKRRAAKRRFCLRRGRATTADDIVPVWWLIREADSSGSVLAVGSESRVNWRERGGPTWWSWSKGVFRRGVGLAGGGESD